MRPCALCFSSAATIETRAGDVRCADLVSCDARREAAVLARQLAAHAKLAGALGVADVAIADRAREAAADSAIRALVAPGLRAPALWRSLDDGTTLVRGEPPSTGAWVADVDAEGRST